MKKALIALLVVLVVVGVGYYAFSLYAVSKLDGTGGVPAPQQELQQYASEDGVSFMYPNSYELSSRTEGNAERQWDILVLMPKGYVPPEGGEGPPAITLSIYPNPEGLSLAQWVESDARSNYKLSADGALTPGTMGNEPALFYMHSGLYESDAAVTSHDGKIYLFAAGWQAQGDQIRTDFNDLIKTVQFSDAN